MVKLNQKLFIQKKNMEKIKEYLYVMDFSDASISEIEITKEDENLETCDLLNKYGFNDDECYFMFTTQRITNINKMNGKENKTINSSSEES